MAPRKFNQAQGLVCPEDETPQRERERTSKNHFYWYPTNEHILNPSPFSPPRPPTPDPPKESGLWDGGVQRGAGSHPHHQDRLRALDAVAGSAPRQRGNATSNQNARILHVSLPKSLNSIISWRKNFSLMLLFQQTTFVFWIIGQIRHNLSGWLKQSNWFAPLHFMIKLICDWSLMTFMK